MGGVFGVLKQGGGVFGVLKQEGGGVWGVKTMVGCLGC